MRSTWYLLTFSNYSKDFTKYLQQLSQKLCNILQDSHTLLLVYTACELYGDATRISQTIIISKTIHLKALSLLHDFQHYLQKMNSTKQAQISTLCQQELKECNINAKVGFDEVLSMQGNFI